jgi:glycosyltransferase involved in cell wall biosynthesis
MATLSMTMIAKNEAPRIGEALKCASKVCDELIVVDTGSEDNTRAIAQQNNAKVFDFEWSDDFSAARNYALLQSTCDWCLILDADDQISDADIAAIQKLKETVLTDDLDGVFTTYQYSFDGLRCTYEFVIQRFVRRASGAMWKRPIHEYIEYPDPNRVRYRPDICIQHYPEGKNRNDRSMHIRILKNAIDGGDTSARTAFYYANELRDNGQYIAAIEAYNKFNTLPDGAQWERYHAHLSIYRCHIALGESEFARAAASRAILHDPSRAEGYVNLGLVEYNRNNWAAAIPLFEAALHCTKPTSGFLNAEMYSWFPYDCLSICYFKTGDFRKAIECASKSLPENPDRARVASNIQFYVSSL